MQRGSTVHGGVVQIGVIVVIVMGIEFAPQMCMIISGRRGWPRYGAR
jgi:hypothetical protein